MSRIIRHWGLGIALLLLPVRHAAAQEIHDLPGLPKTHSTMPSPCQAPDRANEATLTCLSYQLALADTLDQIEYRQAVVMLAPPTRDSLIRDQESWLSKLGQPPAVPDVNTVSKRLIELRRRGFQLLHWQNLQPTVGDTGRRPLIPVGVRFSVAFDRSNGTLLNLQNFTDHGIFVECWIYDPLSDERRLIPFFIEPYSSGELGWVQRWRFAPGQLVEVRSATFRPILTDVPEVSGH